MKGYVVITTEGTFELIADSYFVGDHFVSFYRKRPETMVTRTERRGIWPFRRDVEVVEPLRDWSPGILVESINVNSVSRFFPAEIEDAA